jgi:hypothetical protein
VRDERAVVGHIAAIVVQHCCHSRHCVYYVSESIGYGYGDGDGEEREEEGKERIIEE